MPPKKTRKESLIEKNSQLGSQLNTKRSKHSSKGNKGDSTHVKQPPKQEQVSILISSGLIDSVTQLFRDFAHRGLPTGNIFEFAARVMDKKQRRMLIKIQKQKNIERDLKYKQMKDRKRLEHLERIQKKKDEQIEKAKQQKIEEEKRRKEAKIRREKRKKEILAKKKEVQQARIDQIESSKKAEDKDRIED